MALSEHFHKSEFACHCGCGVADVDINLVDLLELIRRQLDTPIYVLSGVRCLKHNRNVKGALNSQHLIGKAADIHVPNMSTKKLYDFIDKKFNVGGMGLYPSFIHIDIRSGHARWSL
ncbi:MAG: DUF882 domain-containing protein [Methylovulum sp.]|nr:DUF882 domain-containing protein [Methylovulum sp.]